MRALAMRHLLFSILLLFSNPLLAQELVEFENGKVADADDINGNFDLLESQIDELSAQLKPGFDGSTQVYEVDCAENPEALQEVVNDGVSANAQLQISINGSCNTEGLFTVVGQRLIIFGDNPDEDKLVSTAATWAVAFSIGEIRLFNLSVVKYPGNRSGLYAWRGGILYLGNVNVEAPAAAGDSSSFYCVNAELGSKLYISGLSCESYNKGIGLNVSSAAWLRGTIDISAATNWAIVARGSSSYTADRLQLNVSGTPAMHIYDNSSFRQQFGNEETQYSFDGDILVEAGSALLFYDGQDVKHTNGTLSVTDAVVRAANFHSGAYVLKRSSGYLSPAASNASISAHASDIEVVVPTSLEASELQVSLVNSTMEYAANNGPSPASFDCSGLSNVTVNGDVLPQPGTGKCASD